MEVRWEQHACSGANRHLQGKYCSFDEYEARVLQLLGGYGATLVERLRAVDGNSEVHLLDFPDERAFEAFRDDPTRVELQDLWQSCAATSTLTEMVRLA